MQLAFQVSSENIDDDNVTYLQCVLDRRLIAEGKPLSCFEQCSVPMCFDWTLRRDLTQ